jgi:hypothetical protein
MDEFTDPLRVRAKRSSQIKRITPFIRWVPQAAVAGSSPSWDDAALLEIEGFILSFSSYTPLSLKVHPAAELINVRAAERLLLLAATILTSIPIDSTCSVFDVSALIEHHARAYPEISLELTHLDFMDLLPTDLTNAPLDADAVWFTHTDLQDWLCTDGTFFKGAFFIRAFGYRYESGNRTDPQQQYTLVAKRLKSIFLHHSSGAAPPPPDHILGPLIAKWAVSLTWPDVLLMQPVSVISAFEEIDRIVNYSFYQGTRRSAVLLSVLPRARFELPSLFDLLGTSHNTPEVLSCGPLMSKMGLSGRDPAWEDLVAFNDQLTEDLLELIADVPDVPGSVRQKLSVLLADKAADKQSKSVRPANNSSFDGALFSSAITADQAPALASLRRSSALRNVMRGFMYELSQDPPDRCAILKIGARSRISSVYKLTFGLLHTLDFGELYSPVIQMMSGHRIAKLKIGKCKSLARYLWREVFGWCFEEYPQMEDERFSESFAISFVSGHWGRIDFEQRLVLDANAAKLGPIKDRDFNRAKSTWHQDEHLMRDVEEPLTDLMHSIGYSSKIKRKHKACSFPGVIQLVLKGFQYARDHPSCASSVRVKSVQAFETALEDAADQYTDFITDPSPSAPFMKSHIPTDSRYSHALERALKAFNDVMALAANCDEFRELLAHKAKRQSPATTDPPEKKQKKQKKQLLAIKQQAPSSNATPPSKASRYLKGSPPEPGSAVIPLKVNMNLQEGWVEIANSRWDIAKLKAFLKQDKCWPCVITRQQYPDAVCLCPTKAGHVRGGDDSMHQIKDHDRQHILSNFKLFGVYMGDRGRFQAPNQRRGGGSAAALAIEPAKAIEFAKCSQCGGLEHASNDVCSGNGQPC